MPRSIQKQGAYGPSQPRRGAVSSLLGWAAFLGAAALFASCSQGPTESRQLTDGGGLLVGGGHDSDSFTLESAMAGTTGGGAAGQGDIGPSELQASQAAYAWLTSVATPAEIAPLIAAGVGGTVLNYSVFVEATQGVELFSLFVPDSPADQPRPLLTAFHGAATSHGDIYFRAQQFFVEADQRDWFLIAPLQANLTGPQDVSYASVQSQLHVEVLIDLILKSYAIDRDRLYGVGFSMGGGNALSYAARHRDRRTGAFAALVNHTGSVALSDVHRNAPVSIADVLEVIFGGPPDGPAFEWQRSSLIELDASGALLPGGVHMARNLVSVPIQTWFNTQDSFAYLRNQQMEFSTFMESLPGHRHELITVPGGVGNCFDQHCWGTLDIPAVCDWLEQQTLDRSPLSGTVLMDRDARWGAFDVEMRQSTAFASFEFERRPAQNQLVIEQARNLSRVRASVARLGLTVDGSAGQPLTVSTRGFEGAGTAIELRGFSAAPSFLRRNGVPFGPTCGGSPGSVGWCYDAAEGTVTIRETSNLAVLWSFP
ncbi:MAG: hypothetical protein AAGG01_17870 [Planctomycetota bacterium]